MSDRHFPQGFRWGAATSGYQTEGGNLNTGLWRAEWAAPEAFEGPSADACDSYHRYGEDIALLAAAGLDTYRFSVEWSRVEPERGFYSRAALEHYRRMCISCIDHGVEPLISLNHFIVPRWQSKQGGFEQPDSVEAFAAYSMAVAEHLGDLVRDYATFNEPNLAQLMIATDLRADGDIPAMAVGTPMAAVGATLDNIAAAHRETSRRLRSMGKSVGWTLAIPAFQAIDGGEAVTAERRARALDPFLEISRDDDWIGVQTYTRERFGPSGRVEPPTTAELMETGWEAYGPAIGEAVRYATGVAKVPAFVTENGMATADDGARIRYTARALESLHDAIGDGVAVLGYLHWSLLDNWEWSSGFDKHFGLIEIDLQSFERTPKPSLAWLGEIAKSNALPG